MAGKHFGPGLGRRLWKSQSHRRERLWTRLHFWVRERQVDEWAERTNIFFVLALGRSGTTFLAHLLDKAPEAAIFHEPVHADFGAYRRAFHEPASTMEYVNTFRKKEIYLRVRGKPLETYGEVNSVLRRHAVALQAAFPNSTLIHLIRDGRDVIRSMMARKTMGPADRNTEGIRPRPGDKYAEAWEEMDRFAQLCWYWQVENAYLRRNVGHRVQLEALLAGYDYFCEHLLEPVGLQLPAAIWKEAVDRPRNVTTDHVMPPWEEWTSARKETFRAICGEEMRKNGYDF